MNYYTLERRIDFPEDRKLDRTYRRRVKGIVPRVGDKVRFGKQSVEVVEVRHTLVDNGIVEMETTVVLNAKWGTKFEEACEAMVEAGFEVHG